LTEAKNGNWVKLYRELLQKPVFHNEKLLKVLIWCLLKARRYPEELTIGQQKFNLLSGQFYTGRFNASEELNMKPSTAWKYLQILKKNQSIDIKSNTKFSIVTVVNWELYQPPIENRNSTCDNKITTKEQQNNTNKKDKKEKNEKKLYKDFVLLSDDEHKKLVERFGQSGVDGWIERLNNYAHQKPQIFNKYKSHYHTILNWADMDKKRNGYEQPKPQARQRTEMELEMDKLVAEMKKDGQL
jgi:hypothetical protein